MKMKKINFCSFDHMIFKFSILKLQSLLNTDEKFLCDTINGYEDMVFQSCSEKPKNG